MPRALPAMVIIFQSDAAHPQATKQQHHMNDHEFIPVSIERQGDVGITISWSDGAVTHWTAGQLRKSCPCASCREKKRAAFDSAAASEAAGKPPMLPVLSAAEARPLRVESMRPVGNYAYNIGFSDGHSSGVFLFELLRNPEAVS